MSPDEAEPAPDIATTAALIGHPTRSAMLWSLLAGETRPAGELARIAGATPQAASAHLAKLTDGGLLALETRGRHRYYRLSGAAAAGALEALAALPSDRSSAERLRAHVPRELRQSRRCWGHLAGALAVRAHDVLLQRGWLAASAHGYEITPAGAAGLEAWDVDVAALIPGRRGLAWPCLDWSERRAHLGGPLAAAILEAALQRGWIAPGARPRALVVTPAGAAALGARLDAAAAA